MTEKINSRSHSFEQFELYFAMQVGLELLIVVALRNRDRLLLMWPLVHDMLSAILAPEHARAANPLVRRAALGLLRICRRLLHYQTDSAHALLKSMQMILRLDPAVAWDLAAAIAREVCSPLIKDFSPWPYMQH